MQLFAPSIWPGSPPRPDAKSQLPALSLRRAAHHLLHFAFLRATGVLPRLQWFFGFHFLARRASGFFAFFLAQLFRICHECCWFLLKMIGDHARSSCAYFSTSFFKPKRGNCTVILASSPSPS